MRYKIVITKVESKTVTKRGDYAVVDKRPWTPQELSKEVMSSHYDEKQFLEKNPLKEIRDYAPSWQGVESEETKVLEQTVDTLDIGKVIRAINNLD